MLPLCYNRPSDFYPRSPCGERRSDIFPVLRFSLFLSTLSLRRATVSLQRWAAHLCDFYPRSPCGERLKLPPPPPLLLPISIHALLAESDVRCRVGSVRPSNFSPRSPCGERPPGAALGHRRPQFLSTLSLRRATHRREPEQPEHIFLSTLSLRRATIMVSCCSSVSPFLSTLSLRRATPAQ